MKKWLFFVAVLFVAMLGVTLSVSAVTISPAIPGMTASPTAGTSPSSFVAGFYKFALMIGGALAFGAVVYGGILYAASAGNPGKQSEGREWIKSALFGLLLLAGAYLILYTVNPDIISLSLPKLPTVTVASAPGNTGSGLNQNDCNNQCALPNTCQQNSDNSWTCVTSTTPVDPSKGVACPPGSSNMCVPPSICTPYATMVGSTYSCGAGPNTPGAVKCNGSNVMCAPPNTCQTDNDIAQGWQSCEGKL